MIGGGGGLGDVDAEQARTVRFQDTAGLATPFGGERRFVAGQDHPLPGERPQMPGRQKLAAQFTFAVPRRHGHDQPPHAPASGESVQDRFIQQFQMQGHLPASLARPQGEPRRTRGDQLPLQFRQFAGTG